MTITEYNYICQLIEAMKKLQPIDQKPDDKANKSNKEN